MRSMRNMILAILLCSWIPILSAQSVTPLEEPAQTLRQWNGRILESAARPGSRQGPQDYRIGPEDLIEISVFEVAELSRTARVSATGKISLPLLGQVEVVGLTPLELERVLTTLLRQSYVKDPQVTVFVREYRSDPVSVVGAVKVPGVYYIQGPKKLIEVLAMAQGFAEGPHMQAGQTIVITHSPKSFPMTDAGRSQEVEDISSPGDPLKEEPTAWAEISEVPIKELLQSGDPKWNVPIFPGDVVKVVPAGTVYVAGDVNNPGGFPLTDFDQISAIQALAMGGGNKRSADLKNAVVIRVDKDGNRTEEEINMKRILQGKDPDVTLGANDILLIPGSMTKTAALRALETAIQLGTGILIFR